MLIATSIFVVVAMAFVGILSMVTQVQVQSSSSAVVNQENQFLLQKLQILYRNGKFRGYPYFHAYFHAETADGEFIVRPNAYHARERYGLSSTAERGNLAGATSNKVSISNLSFTRRMNPPGHDAVSISYTMSYNTPNIEQSFSQFFQTSVAQVSAATFDTGVYPSVNGTEPLETHRTDMEFHQLDHQLQRRQCRRQHLEPCRTAFGGRRSSAFDHYDNGVHRKHSGDADVLFSGRFHEGLALSLRRKRDGNAGMAEYLLTK